MEIIIDRYHNTINVDNVITHNKKKYEIADYIARGGNAVVYECLDIYGNAFAIKFLLKSNNKMLERFNQEISVLKEMKHEHWIKYIDDGEIKTIYKGTETTLRFVVMERAEKNLIEFLKDKEIGYEIYAPQFRGLAKALSELHLKGIHRDIKPENILVKGEKWLLSDLGLCSLLNEEDHVDLTSENEKVGPKYWLSPEAINDIYFTNNTIKEHSDVYQLCAVFWFAVTKKHPLGIIKREDWTDSNDDFFNIIYQALNYNAENRPQNGQVLYERLCEATLQ